MDSLTKDVLKIISNISTPPITSKFLTEKCNLPLVLPKEKRIKKNQLIA